MHTPKEVAGFIVIMPRPPPIINCLSAGGAPSFMGRGIAFPFNNLAPPQPAGTGNGG